MSLTNEQWNLIIAVIGAAAWIPPIVSGIISWQKKSVLTVDAGRYVEVGFTELGPVLNIPVAFTADQNVLISSINVLVEHEAGAKYDFHWHELSEVKGQVFSPDGGSQPLLQISEAIAIKILSTDFKSVLLRNRLERHTEKLHQLNAEWNEERRRLENSGAYDPIAFNDSRFNYEIATYLKSQMIWKSGRYSIILDISNSGNARVKQRPLTFILSEHDISLMNENTNNISRYLKNSCLFQSERANEIEPPIWHWLSIALARASH